MAEAQGEQELLKDWARLVARSWSDDELRKRLVEDPAAVLEESHIPVPEGAELRVVEYGPASKH